VDTGQALRHNIVRSMNPQSISRYRVIDIITKHDTQEMDAVGSTNGLCQPTVCYPTRSVNRRVGSTHGSGQSTDRVNPQLGQSTGGVNPGLGQPTGQANPRVRSIHGSGQPTACQPTGRVNPRDGLGWVRLSVPICILFETYRTVCINYLVRCYEKCTTL